MPRPTRTHYRFLLLVLFAVATGGAAETTADADPAERIQTYIRAGAPDLALEIVDRYQTPDLLPLEWMRWERLRLSVYTEREDYDGIVATLERAPADLPAEFREELVSAAARAYIQGGHPAAGRALLARYLWADGSLTAPRRDWRALVVRSYLAEDAVQDALTAMHRFQAEFRPSSESWRHLNARVLLRAGQFREAALQVATDQTHEGRWLHLLARLRDDPKDLEPLLKSVRKLVNDADRQPAWRSRAWGLLALAAVRSNDPLARAGALEQALPLSEPLLGLAPDDLWDAWLELGKRIGNDAGLLVGEDARWLKAAERRARNQQPVAARALLAVTALEGNDPESRDLAHLRLARSMQRVNPALPRLLYIDTRRFAELAAVPAPVRHLLSEAAIKRLDIAFAARAVAGLETPPPDLDADEWQMRRARLAVLSGDYARGVELVREYLGRTNSLEGSQADALMQVVFDLQTASQNETAFELFREAHQRVATPRLKRETLYWMGEVRAAQKRHREAAALFLQSAAWEKSDPTDLWGQSARYQAAHSLARAGLNNDAQRIYQSLLAVTVDPKRRAALERSIQQLWLLGPASTTQ
ncbi:MAG: hypothetical protein LJE84_13270 [Gammaproteobacteria bacterium]|nr:hypothetical protein [Gammaproteobacteria bacterium]